LSIGNPEQTSSRLAVQRGGGSVADTENPGVSVGSITNLGEAGNTVGARKLEGDGGVLDNVDVDITSLQRVHTSTGIDGVVVLVGLDDGVEVVGAVAVTTHVVEVDPVGLTTLTGNNTNTLVGAAREGIGENLQGAGTQIVVGTVKLLLLERHEEVDNIEASVLLDGHVNGSLLEGSGCRITLDGNRGKLRLVTVSGSEEDGATAVGSNTTTRHPDTATLLDHTLTLGGESLDKLTGGLVDAEQPASELVLDAVRAESDVNVLTNVQQTGSLELDTTVEHTPVAVSGGNTLQVDREVGLLSKSVDIDGVNEVSTGGAALSNIELGLVGVGLSSEVEGVGIGIDNTGADDTNVRADILATIEIGGEEGNVQVSLGNDLARLGVDLVDVVLGGRVVDVLSIAAGRRVNERLGEGLFGLVSVVSRHSGLENLTKLRTGDYGRIHVMVTINRQSLVPSAKTLARPSSLGGLSCPLTPGN
jgi:hypothetical protein